MHTLLTSLINELNASKAIRQDGPASVLDPRLSGADLAARFDAYSRQFAGCFDVTRGDANEAATLARQLLAINAKEVTNLYTKLKAVQFIPVDGSLASGADSYTTAVYSEVGTADIVTNYGNGFPASEVSVSEVIKPLRSIGNSYHYTVQDLRAAAMSGRPLEQRRASVARLVHDRKIERLAAWGSTVYGLPGMLTNSTVNLMLKSGGVGPDLTGSWETASAAHIFADLNAIVSQVSVQSQGLFEGNTMILPLAAYEVAASTAYSTLNGESVLSVFMKSNPHIRNVDSWAMCDNFDENGASPISNSTKTRAVCYDRNANVLDQKISQAFEQFAPQQVHMQFNVDCHSRHGGTVVYYPIAMVYADDLSDLPSA